MRVAGLVCCLLISAADARADDAATWAENLSTQYGLSPNITYQTAGGIDLKLDVYAQRDLRGPNPVVVYYHGGGWMGGGREYTVLRLMPWLEMGYSVVNVTYRGSRVAPAPAAVEDCRCALRWVIGNAAKHKFDTTKIILTGDSEGSHLALMSGIATGFDESCPHAAKPAVALIINWFGATDIGDLLEGDNRRDFAVAWLKDQPDREALAKRLSPLNHVRAGLPPILSIHGDADQVVPHDHAARLHAALTKHEVPNKLVTVPGGTHGGFTPEQNAAIWKEIRAFLALTVNR